MSGRDFLAMLPLVVLTAAALIVTVAICVRRNRSAVAWLSASGLVLAAATLPVASAITPHPVTVLLMVDDFAVFYLGVLFAAALAVIALAHGYMERMRGFSEELHLLVLLGTLGAGVLVTSRHFASFFLGLELLTVPLYVLIAFPRQSEKALEAGVKYLILAAVSSAFLLFGMALVYAQTGTMQFALLGAAETVPEYSPVLLAGVAMIIAAIGFKLAVVPFHMWTPDVYQGAPAPVTAFIATVSKGGMVGVLLRFFFETGGHDSPAVQIVFGAIAVASMVIGNLLALLQNSVKRILAYSSIAHLGYLLVAFLASGALALQASTYYLVTYVVTTLAAFGVVAALSDGDEERDALVDYRGLFWRRPGLAAIFTATLLSLAGIPLTAGFVGKFFVVAAGAQAALWSLVLVLVLGSVIGLFYYLRIMVVMYAEAEPAELPALPRPRWTELAALAALVILLVWIGVYPTLLGRTIERSVATIQPVTRTVQPAAY